MKVKFPCPGQDDGECCEGALWLRGAEEAIECPRCNGRGELELPSKLEVCGRCRGTGVHDHPAFSNGISGEEFAEDPDFREEYLSGRYDVQCEECGGRNVVPVVNAELCDKVTLEAYWKHLEEEASYRRECEMERRMGA